MGAGIFISYRSTDGRDKATALARDLGALFGEAQVFLDKDDLPAGTTWRQEVARALGTRPVVLLLVTPEVLATGAGGGRRIAQADDPIRLELETAFAAGARVIPVLADGVDGLPAATELPPPFDRLAELTWRRLRAYDWPADVQRLAADLRAHGVALQPRPGAAPRRRAAVVAAAAVAALVALAGAWWALEAQRTPAGLGGDWTLSGSGNAPFVLSLRQDGPAVQLRSRPVSIAERADWAEYRAFWRERHGEALGDIIFRGEGLAAVPPGAALEADIELTVADVKHGEKIDGGNLHLTLSRDARVLAGTWWLNSEQRERRVELQRLR